MPNLPLPSKEVIESIRYKCPFCQEYQATNIGGFSYHCPKCNVDFSRHIDLRTVSIVIFYLNKKHNKDRFYYLWIDYERHETGLIRRSKPLNPKTDGVIFVIPQVFPDTTPQNARQLARRLQKLKAFS